MNGCRYCVIMHHRKRRGKQRARGVAMCLAQEDLIRCDKKWHERGPGCEFHDHKADAADQQQVKSAPPVAYVRSQRRQQREPLQTTAT